MRNTCESRVKAVEFCVENFLIFSRGHSRDHVIDEKIFLMARGHSEKLHSPSHATGISQSWRRRSLDDDPVAPGVTIYGSLLAERAVRRRRRVLLCVAANEIIIGGLSHSSSTAAWQSRWLFGDGAVAAAVAARW